MARKLARKLLQEAEIESIPVSIRDVVRHLNVEVIKWNFDETINGIQVNYDGKNYIGYRSDDPTVRKRASVSHEIGHLVLKHADVSNLDRLEFSRDQVKENEAWVFARELLMPIKIFKQEFAKNQSIDYLAWKFWVSKEMAGIRISELGLLNKIDI